MSMGNPIGLAGWFILCRLCQHNEVILGGSLGLELNKESPDPFAAVHDLDLVFRTKESLDRYIADTLLTIPGAVVGQTNCTPYFHCSATVSGIHICLFVNWEATVRRVVYGIRIQPASEIECTKAAIYAGKKYR